MILAALLVVAGVLLTLGNLFALDLLPGAPLLRFIDLPVHLVNVALMLTLAFRARRQPRPTMVVLLACAGILASLASILFRASTLTEAKDDALIAHGVQFLSFLFLVAGISATLRVRSGIWTPLLRLADTSNIGLGLGLLFWYFVLRENTSAMYYGEAYGPFVEAAYPMFDFLMVLVLVDHVRLGDIGKQRAVIPLALIVASFVVGDLLFNFASAPILESAVYAVGDVLWGFAILGYLLLGRWLLQDPTIVEAQPKGVRRSLIRKYAGLFAVAALVLTAISELLQATEINEVIWIIGVVGILTGLAIRQVAGAAATRIWLESQNDLLHQEVERRTADLAVKTRQAEAASRAKSEFLANISHELRTPLNAVIGNLALATSSNLAPEEQKYFDRASKSADALSRVIGDILEFVKLDTDDSVMRRDEFSIESTFGFLRGRLGSSASRKGIELRFDVAPDVPALVIGDRYRLSQVLVHLIDNAIKFTDRGVVTVMAQVAVPADAAGRIKLRFDVRDSGAGMSPEQVDKLFTDFGQLDASASRRHGGSGLGLAICSRVVGLLGGSIRVESTPERGSTFIFDAEFDSVQAPEVAAGEEGGSASRLLGARVLLVEDNLLNRELANKILASAGVDVINAEHGREALDILDCDADIDGVLMDIHMPVMDGYAATRAIRAQERFRDLPIIAVTANVMLSSTADAEAVGMNDCVPKPLKPSLLFDIMAKWIKPARIREVRVSVATVGDATASDEASAAVLRIPGVDVEKALGQTLNDLAFYRRMLRRFVESHANFKDEFRAAQLSSDGSAALRSAHTLKGNAANIGATALETAAANLENSCRNRDSVDAIELAFKDTVAQLALVLEGVRRISEPAPGSLPAAAAPGAVPDAVDEQELHARLERIRQLLRDSDPGASELLLETTHRFAGSAHAAILQRATTAAEQFEFEEALRELESL